jgi:hypothetical protein
MGARPSPRPKLPTAAGGLTGLRSLCFAEFSQRPRSSWRIERSLFAKRNRRNVRSEAHF